MTSRPRWLIWTAATVVLWTVWIAFVFLPLQRRDDHEQAVRAEWAGKHQDMMARIEMAPQVMSQIVALTQSLDSATAKLSSPITLREFLYGLGELGRQSGVQSVEAAPELSSMISLNQSNYGPTLVLDTLSIELRATGRFHEVGHWLELVETQPAFRSWRLIRWDKGEDPGTVTFDGFASILVAVPQQERS